MTEWFNGFRDSAATIPIVISLSAVCFQLSRFRVCMNNVLSRKQVLKLQVECSVPLSSIHPEMQTSMADNSAWMSCQNSDQSKPSYFMMTSQLIPRSSESALTGNSLPFFDSPGIQWPWYSSDGSTLVQPYQLIEKRGQLVHGCYFLNTGEEDIFQARVVAGSTSCTGIASQETSHVNGFYGTEISPCTGPQIPQCQVEGCHANLSSAKQYHRRYKVCELHSKASMVVVGGLIQRFCQQCSRFHPRSEFDQRKRSCRNRLAVHNKRRRKPQPSRCTASQREAGTAVLEDQNQKTEGSSAQHETGLQITPNNSTSTTQSLITSVTSQYSVPMMMFPNNYEGQIPVLQGTSNNKTSCVDFLNDSREYQLVQPCSLKLRLLASEITGRLSGPAAMGIQHSDSHISMKNSHSNLRVIETSKSLFNHQIFSSSNGDIPLALSKNGGSHWILNGSSAEGI